MTRGVEVETTGAARATRLLYLRWLLSVYWSLRRQSTAIIRAVLSSSLVVMRLCASGWGCLLATGVVWVWAWWRGSCGSSVDCLDCKRNERLATVVDRVGSTGGMLDEGGVSGR